MEKYHFAGRCRFREIDTVHFNHLHKGLSKRMKKPDAMNNFFNLTYKCFKHVSSTDWFLEGVHGTVLDCMLYRDLQTGRSVFSLISTLEY